MTVDELTDAILHGSDRGSVEPIGRGTVYVTIRIGADTHCHWADVELGDGYVAWEEEEEDIYGMTLGDCLVELDTVGGWLDIRYEWGESVYVPAPTIAAPAPVE